jgi:peptidoglycan/xylan/chitin deacetylase (PgdA/CDA1 family)
MPRAARRMGRAMLWQILTGADWLERRLRRPRRPGEPLAETSRGRFRGPCGLEAEPAWGAVPALPVVRRRAKPWQRLALAGFAGFALVGGALMHTARRGAARAPAGPAAIAGPEAPAPPRVTAADRAALAKCSESLQAPKRRDVMGPERRSKAETGLQPWVIRQGRGTEKVVALTFDDGPSPATTPKVLETLRSAGVPATFFVMGQEVEQHPDLARRIVAEGHALGNHTWNHLYLDRMDAACTTAEMEISGRLIESVTGYHPNWFRPPGGLYTEDALRTAHSLNERIVLWSQDARDWASPGEAEIRRRILADLAPGHIILLHDTRRQTAAVLPALIEEIRGRGYRFVRLDELTHG